MSYTPNDESPLYNFYFRYAWSHNDFAGLQDALIGLERDMLGTLAGPSLLEGGVVAPSGSTRAVTVQPYVAIANDGYLNVSNAVVLAPVTANSSGNPRKDLIVARRLLVDDTTITRPTSPFDPVPLKTLQKTQVVVIPGTPAGSPAYPSKLDGDVIIAGLAVANGATSFSSGNIDTTVTELISTNTNFANWVVGKDTHGTASISGDSGATRETLSIVSASSYAALKLTGNLNFGSTSNPSKTTGFANVFTPLNMPKAWGSLHHNGVGALTWDGFNVATVTEPSANVMRVTFATVMADANYAVILHGGNGHAVEVPEVNRFAGYFDIIVYTGYNNTPASDLVNNLTDFVVFGRQ